MPYVSQMTEEEKKKKAAEQGVDVSNNSSTSFAQAQNTGAQTPKPIARSGSFVNLQSYLSANAQNTPAMADKVVGTVNNQAQTAQDGINNLKVAAPGVINKVNVDDWFTNPNANKKTEYASLKNTGGYNGPDSVDKITGYGETQSNAQKAKEKVDSLNTEPGRFNLLQDAYARPNYSQGMKKLDNSLLRQDTSAKAKFENTNTQWKGILDQFNDTSKLAGDNIKTNIDTAFANKNDLLAGETNARNSLINPIQARAAQATQDNKALADRALADAQDETLSDETLALLGLSEGQQLYGLTPASYLSPDYSEVGLDNAATAEERARYQALAAMIDDASMNQITKDGKAIKPVNFDRARFDQDVAASSEEYNRNINTPVNGNNLNGFPLWAENTGKSPAQLKQWIEAERQSSLYAQRQNIRDYVEGLNAKVDEVLNIKKVKRG